MSAYYYEDFSLLIQHIEYNRYSAKANCNLGGNGSTEWSIPFEDAELSNIKNFQWRETSQSTSLSPEIFGAKLYDAVFRNGVKDCFVRSLSIANERRIGLRISLQLNDVPELASLPWEFLHGPSPYGFFALSVKTPIVRDVELLQERKMLLTDPPILILGIMSSPKDRQLLAVQKEWEALKKSLSNLIKDKLIKLERTKRPTVDSLRKRLSIQKQPVSILHFMGHGDFNEQLQDGVLILERDDQQSDVIEAKKLADLLRDHDSLRLVFLNICEGAHSNIYDFFSGTAQRLAQVGVPAVIATQHRISDDTAIEFASAFYHAITNKPSIDFALAEARKALRLKYNNSEWGTPILFMRATDATLFNADKNYIQSISVEGPIILERPIEINGFVGRDQEIVFFLSQLRSKGIIIIDGLPRIGKTWLAIKIAKTYQPESKKIFFYGFRSGVNDKYEILLDYLAEFLDQNGQAEAKAFILAQRKYMQTGGQRFSNHLCILNGLTNDDFVLCLDNLHVVENDETIESFIEDLGSRIKSQTRTKLIGVGRERPRVAGRLRVDVNPINGLSLDDTRSLLERQRLHLPKDGLNELSRVTGGIPGLIWDLVPDLYRLSDNSKSLSDFLEQVSKDRARNYDEPIFEKDLGANERKILMALSVPRKPIDNLAVGQLLVSENLPEISHILEKLLQTHRILENDFEEYSLHDFIREYYAKKLDLNHKMRQRFLRNLAAHYERRAVYLESAYYYAQVDEEECDEVAANLICRYFDKPIDTGESEIGLDQLLSLSKKPLLSSTTLIVQEKIGDLSVLLGNYQLAVEHYTLALDESNSSEPILPLHLAELRRKLGKVYERRGYVRLALDEYEQGSQYLTADLTGTIVGVRLTKDKAWALYRVGDLDGALKLCQEGLDIATHFHEPVLSGELLLLRAEISISETPAKYHEAEADILESIGLFERANDRYNLGAAKDYLASVQYFMGRVVDADKSFKDALQIRQDIGDKRGIAITHNNWAYILYEKGDYGKARANYDQAFEIYNALNDLYGISVTLQNLAEVDIAQAKFCEALDKLQQSFHTSKIIEDVAGLGYILELLDKLDSESEPEDVCRGGSVRESVAELRRNANNALA